MKLRGGNLTTTNASVRKFLFNGKELQNELGLNWYDFQGRQYMQDLGRTTTIDPFSEKFYDLSPQSFLNNNPLRFIDPTGMESQDSIDPPGKKTAMQRAYNPKTGNTDIGKLVLNVIGEFINSVNTYTNITDKEVTTTATSKKSNGENQKSTGNKTGDNIDADAFIDGAPSKANAGNNFGKTKDILKAVKDVNSMFKKGQKTGESINEVVKENTTKQETAQTEFVRVSYDPKTESGTWVRKDIYDAQQQKK